MATQDFPSLVQLVSVARRLVDFIRPGDFVVDAYADDGSANVVVGFAAAPGLQTVGLLGRTRWGQPAEARLIVDRETSWDRCSVTSDVRDLQTGRRESAVIGFGPRPRKTVRSTRTWYDD